MKWVIFGALNFVCSVTLFLLYTFELVQADIFSAQAYDFGLHLLFVVGGIFTIFSGVQTLRYKDWKWAIAGPFTLAIALICLY